MSFWRDLLSSPMHAMIQDKGLQPGAFPAAPECILVVDDEDLIRETVALALAAEGYRVITANSGSQAMDLLGSGDRSPANPPAIDLAILDLMLPGMDGLEVCRRLRRGRCGRNLGRRIGWRFRIGR